MSCQSELFKTAWREEEEEARKSRQVDSRVNKHLMSVLLPETNSVLWWPFRFVAQKTIQQGAFYTFQSLIVFSLKCFLLNWHLCVVWNLPSSSPGGRHETLQLHISLSCRKQEEGPAGIIWTLQKQKPFHHTTKTLSSLEPRQPWYFPWFISADLKVWLSKSVRRCLLFVCHSLRRWDLFLQGCFEDFQPKT